MLDALSDREGLQPGGPCKCLEHTAPQRRSSQKGSLGRQGPEAGRRLQLGHSIPAHPGPPGSPRSKPLRPLHAQPPLGQSCQRLGRTLEPHTSHISSHRLPWVPRAARVPAIQAAAPPPQLALPGADPGPPGRPQEQPQWTTHRQRWRQNHS